MAEGTEEKKSNLNKISLPDGTVFYCNDKFLKDLKEEIFNCVREENIKKYLVKL